ncbi:transposase family protein [Nocardia sp. NPDC059154]|uniref:transposase family protein n=1 Tax=Nocardia sp. NPDC059154 TaxID=3346744 RepID=UPI0036AE9B17
MCRGVLFPHLDGLEVGAVHGVDSPVCIDVATGGEPVDCPSCSVPSRRVHSRYRRRMSDTSITGREVVIALRVCRLFCDNFDCGRRTFAEQVPQLAARYGRRTLLLQRVLCAVALALGGRAGARLTGHLAARVSRMTLLRQIRALPDPTHPTPRVLSVADFALHRGTRCRRPCSRRLGDLPGPNRPRSDGHIDHRALGLRRAANEHVQPCSSVCGTPTSRGQWQLRCRRAGRRHSRR